MPTDAKHKAMMARLRADLAKTDKRAAAWRKAASKKHRAEFAEADRRADLIRLRHEGFVPPSGATAPGFSILIAPRPASNVVSLDAARVQRKATREKVL
jgi:hypothetical protein